MMRNYLPYKSAREYVDRGMAKWMGFFLSEHTGALTQAQEADSFPDRLNPAEKMILLYQAYANQLTIRLTLKVKVKRVEVTGKIKNLTAQALLLQSNRDSQNIYLDSIVKIEWINQELDQQIDGGVGADDQA